MLSLLPHARLRVAPSDAFAAAAAVPTRPAVILPGLGNNTGDYARLAAVLRDDNGLPAAVVARVSRPDWLRNAAGVADPSYWWCTLRPRPILDWYLNRVEEAVSEARKLCSLGVSGVIDQTRGLLDYVEKNCTQQFTHQNYDMCALLEDHAKLLKYSIVVVLYYASFATQMSATSTMECCFRARLIGQGYKQVCGRANVWGDGVVPEVSAHLEGALNISFDGVYHSPVGSDGEERPWYGSPAILQQWVHHLLS